MARKDVFALLRGHKPHADGPVGTCGHDPLIRQGNDAVDDPAVAP